MLGIPGDIFVDITRGAYRIFVKHARWLEWPGVEKCRHGKRLATSTYPPLFHPNNGSMTIWCTRKNVLWIPYASLRNVRMRFFKRHGAQTFVSTREMIEDTTVLTKEIAEMYEEERKRLRRSPSVSAIPALLEPSPREHMQGYLAINVRYTLRSASQRETSAKTPQSSSPQPHPTTPNRQPTIGPAAHSDTARNNDDSEDDEETPEMVTAVLPNDIKRREAALLKREVKENRVLAELVDDYKRIDEEIEVIKKQERQAKRASSVVLRKIGEVEQKEKESASRKKEILLLQKARRQQERELRKAKRRVQNIYEQPRNLASKMGLESCGASSREVVGSSR